MRSALDIALGRFGGGKQDGAKLTAEQKAKLKEIQDKYDAKIAEVQILADGKVAAARAQGDAAALQEAEQNRAKESASLRRKMEREKNKVREGTA